jgi:hypothetical protein
MYLCCNTVQKRSTSLPNYGRETVRHEARLRQRVDEAAMRRRDCEMAVTVVREILSRLLLTTGESHDGGPQGRGMPALLSRCLTYYEYQ